MPSRSSKVRRQVAQVAAAARWTPERVAERKRRLELMTLEEHIERVVSAAPPLTKEEFARLQAVLSKANQDE